MTKRQKQAKNASAKFADIFSDESLAAASNTQTTSSNSEKIRAAVMLLIEENLELLRVNERLRRKLRLVIYLSRLGRLLHFVKIALRLLHPVLHYLRPRLGKIDQHPPRDLSYDPNRNISIQLTRFPSIAIVIPSFQQGRFIQETIDSVIRQQYPNISLHVQDGGSQDETISVLKKYESSVLSFDSRPDAGQANAINNGFKRVSGEIMAWLNSDDLLMPNSLNLVADFFNRNPNVDVVYGNRIVIDKNGQEIGLWLLPRHDVRVLPWVDFVPQETLFWRRSIWEKVGGNVDESFKFAMDWDLILRFGEAGASFRHLPNLVGAFRFHDEQKTTAIIESVGKSEMARLRLRSLGRVPTQREIRFKILPYILRHMGVDFVHRCKKILRRSA